MIAKKIFLLINLMALLNMVYAQSNPFKAPLYWSVYEHHIVKEQNGVADNYMPESVFMANIDWVDSNLKDLGYNMICVDGWGDVSQLNENGYRTSHSRHWEQDFEWWSEHLTERGMTLGMYGNPLWINIDHNDTDTKIAGTDLPVSSLIDPTEETMFFTWVQVDRPGAEEYVKGYVQYYADMGIKYFRIDFLSWFEDGWDRYLGRVGPERPREHYETALRWMKEAADENGMFLSLVMPHLYEEAEAEVQYGHMIRINEDTGEGTWWKWSEKDRGIKRNGWSVYGNPFDGLTYWSYLTGRNEVILDPDFIRINTFDNDDEKKSVISISLLSGGALTVSDQFNTIKGDLWLYQNKELLELNQDGFVGKPLTNDPTDQNSQIWTGQLSNGHWIVGIFNRENDSRSKSIDFESLGIEGAAQIRDLWAHENLENASSWSGEIPPHGCMILKVAPTGEELTGPSPMHVESFTVSPVEADGGTRVKSFIEIMDRDNNPVEEAFVRIDLTGSFHETLTGITDESGQVVLESAHAVEGEVLINACVGSVSHSEFIYAGEFNKVTCYMEEFFVAGTFSDWTLQPMKFKDGIWTLDLVFMTSGNHEMKFADTGNWTGDDWGNAQGLSGTAELTTGGSPNISFVTADAGLYNISFNAQSLQYVIEKSEETGANDEMYFAGTFNDWTLTPMIFDHGVWKIENFQIESGDHEMKFANTGNWSGDDWGNATGLEGVVKKTTGGEPNLSFTLTKPGFISIEFNDTTLEYVIIPSMITSIGQDGKEKAVLAYPNPTRGIVNLPFKEFQNPKISVYDASGKEINARINDEGQIDLSAFKNGIYFIQIISKVKIQSFKVLKIN